MSARRDPEGRLPPGGGLLLGAIIALVFWGVMAALLSATVLGTDHEITNKEPYHAGQ